MRQVPATPGVAAAGIRRAHGPTKSPTYAVLGNGRLARHWRHYLSRLGLASVCWSRCGQPEANTFNTIDNPRQRLVLTLNRAEVALVLFNDPAIAPFIKKHRHCTNAQGQAVQWVHCAASVHVSGAFCAHPLMTFSASLYPDATYRNMGFACDNVETFRRLFPALPNPAFVVDAPQRRAYHALCVMAGNFPQILWRQCLQEFQSLGVPEAAIHRYLHQVTANFLADPDAALTGPLVRGDAATVTGHLQALPQIDPALAELYAAFVRFYEATNATAPSSPESLPISSAHPETAHEHP
jgi:hypothetical protein